MAFLVVQVGTPTVGHRLAILGGLRQLSASAEQGCFSTGARAAQCNGSAAGGMQSADNGSRPTVAQSADRVARSADRATPVHLEYAELTDAHCHSLVFEAVQQKCREHLPEFRALPKRLQSQHLMVSMFPESSAIYNQCDHKNWKPSFLTENAGLRVALVTEMLFLLEAGFILLFKPTVPTSQGGPGIPQACAALLEAVNRARASGAGLVPPGLPGPWRPILQRRLAKGCEIWATRQCGASQKTQRFADTDFQVVHEEYRFFGSVRTALLPLLVLPRRGRWRGRC